MPLTSPASRLRVAMIIQSYYPLVGGAEKQIAALAPVLRGLGVDVSVVTRRYAGLKLFEMVDDVPVYRMPIPGPKPVKALSFTFFSLIKLAQLKPDVVHAHELLSPATAALAARRLFNVPVAAKVLRGGELGDIAKLKNRFMGHLRLTTLKNKLDKVIVISQEIKDELKELDFPDEKLFMNPNGVDTDRFAPCSAVKKASLRKKLGIGSGLVAIFTGRLSREKRVNHLIEIWPQVLSEFPDAQLLILGEGVEGPHLQEIAKEGVRFFGVVEDVSPYLQAADVFVLPSSTEGLSNALLEAMSTGLPVVATDVGGAPDLISHEHSGLLIPPDDLETLKGAVLSLFANEPLRSRMGERSRQKIVNEFGLELVARRLCDLYVSLAKVA